MAGAHLGVEGQSPNRTIIFEKGRIDHIWAEFTDMTLDVLGDMYDRSEGEEKQVPLCICPLNGGFIPILRVLEGAYKRSLENNKWQSIYSKLTERDEQGFKNIIFTVKTDTIESDGMKENIYEFSRTFEEVNSALVIEDIADSLATYDDLASVVHPDIEMCVATCKASTSEKLLSNAKIHVPSSGVIPYIGGRDPWVFGSIGMNRRDEQGFLISALQRKASVMYTANCADGEDFPWLINFPQDEIAVRYAKNGGFLTDALLQLDKAKVEGKAGIEGRFEELLKTADTWLHYYVGSMPSLVA